MAKNSISAECDLDDNSDCEGYKNEDIGDCEPIVPDSDPGTSDIGVSSVEFSKVSSYPTEFGDEWDDDATITANANIHNWTTNFTDITIEPFT